MHARINDSKQAKLASDKLRLYVESRKLKTENAMVKKQAGVRLAMPLARRVDDDTDAIRVAARARLSRGRQAGHAEVRLGAQILEPQINPG